jgi:diaminopimelate decarboxylase
MAAATRTVYPESSSVEQGRLTIGGCDAAELAREFGTPAYIVAEDDLRARAVDFRDALRASHPGPGEVVFASKAFPCTAVLRVFEEEGLSVDVASGGELHMARRAGYGPDRIVVHGNAKSEEELRRAAALGARLVIDNHDEIDRLETLARGAEPLRVLIRVAPGVEPDTHHAVSTGQADSKFGFSLEDAARAVDRLREGAWADLRGLHMHIGSLLFDLEPYREAMEAMATLGPFQEYDLGGGFGVPYTSTDRHMEAAAFVGALVEAAHEVLGAREKRLVLEPGRALVANAGVTLYTVESVKRTVRTWVSVDGGMSDNLRPMLYGAVYDADLVERMRSGPGDGAMCTVAGKHCESGDVLVRDVRLRDPRPGDLLVTPATGAYGHAMANNYNGVPRPPVIFCSGGDARVVVRRETLEDLERRDA